EGTAIPLPVFQNGTTQNDNGENITTNTTQYFNLTSYAAENLSIEVVEVSDLDEVIFYLTGKQLNHKEVQIEEDEEYTRIMKNLRDLLCSRVDKTEAELHKEGVSVNETVAKRVEEQKGKAENATLQKDYYSAASYCFTASIALRTNYYVQKKPALPLLWDRFLKLEDKVKVLEQNLSQQKIETITDLQTMIIVKDRLDDVMEQIAVFRDLRDLQADKKDEEHKKEAYAILSYSEERYFSAVAWTQFFSMGGKSLQLDQEHIRQSCQQKILEADERYQYIGLFIGENNLDAIAKKIISAKEASEKGEYELCLMKAIQAKGDTNAVLSTMGLSSDEFTPILESKMVAVKRVIAENTAEGKFPILGYSYFRYANSLKEQEPVTALFYLEYALETSDLSIYFPEEKTVLEKVSSRFSLDKKRLEGFAVGFLLALILLQLFHHKKKVRRQADKYLKELGIKR
ncbi:MAG: hypothetical protein AABY40_02290, partial [Nanoarchaeota archaeon]